MPVSWLDQKKKKKKGIYTQHFKKTGFNTLTLQQPQFYILKY